MKQLFISTLSLAVILSSALFIQPRFAQAQAMNRLDIDTSRAVAFVKSDRTVLYIKRQNKPVEKYDIVAMVRAIMGNQSPLDSIWNLSVIGMSPDQSQIVLGGDILYLDSTSGSQTHFEGIFRIPWPLTVSTVLKDLPYGGSGAPWFLFQNPVPGDFHASGILTPDGKQWFAATRTWSPGEEVMQFYHGSTSGGKIDTATITQDIAGNKTPPAEGWVESNIALDTASNPNTMLVIEVDGLESAGDQSQRYLMIHWQPGSNPQPFADDLTNAIRGKSNGVQFAIDSLFAVSCVPLQDGHHVDIGLQHMGGSNDTKHDIEYYTATYNPRFDGNLNQSRVLSHDVLPALPDTSFTFFAGDNAPGDNAAFVAHAQSGDIMVTNDRNTALFITHESPTDWYIYPGSPRNKYSAIFSYDFNGSGTATMLYNDTNAQELQPVFVPSVDTIPHVAGITAPPTINFNTVDTGKTATQMLTITDTSAWNGTIIDSVKITGDNEFTVLSPNFPDTILYGGAGQINLQFAPVGAAGTRNATLTVYSSRSADNKVTVNLTGMAKVMQPKSVKEDPALAANVSIEPNPFSSVANVELTAPDACALSIEVYDALGHLIYTSPVHHVAAGETQLFAFDAKSLSLSNGIYYVTAIFGDRQVTRQVVFSR